MAVLIKYGSYTFTRNAEWEETLSKKIDPSSTSNIVNNDGVTVNTPTKLEPRKIVISGKITSTTQSGLETLEKNLRKAMLSVETEKLWLWDDKYYNAKVKSVKTVPVSGSGVLAMDYSIEFYCDDPYIYTTSASHEDFAISGATLTAVHTCLSLGKVYPKLKILATDVITSGFIIKKTDGETISQLNEDVELNDIGQTENEWTAGQSFTPAKSGILTSITVQLKRYLTPTGNIRILVKAWDGSAPTGDVLASSDYISAMAVSDSVNGAPIKFNFNDDVALTAATQYVFYYDFTYSESATNYLTQCGYEAANDYAGGVAVYATYAGVWSSWAAKDAYFSIEIGSGEEDSITVNQALANGDELVIDTKEGMVELNGTSILNNIDRGGDLDMFLTYGDNNFSLSDMGAAGAGVFRIEYNMREY